VVATVWRKANFNLKVYDEPEKFNPERWTKENKIIDLFAFIPFGAGPRNCIGQHLSQIETMIVMSEFLSRFEFKVSEGYLHQERKLYILVQNNTTRILIYNLLSIFRVIKRLFTREVLNSCP